MAGAASNTNSPTIASPLALPPFVGDGGPSDVFLPLPDQLIERALSFSLPSNHRISLSKKINWTTNKRISLQQIKKEAENEIQQLENHIKELLVKHKVGPLARQDIEDHFATLENLVNQFGQKEDAEEEGKDDEDDGGKAKPTPSFTTHNTLYLLDRLRSQMTEPLEQIFASLPPVAQEELRTELGQTHAYPYFGRCAERALERTHPVADGEAPQAANDGMYEVKTKALPLFEGDFSPERLDELKLALQIARQMPRKPQDDTQKDCDFDYFRAEAFQAIIAQMPLSEALKIYREEEIAIPVDTLVDHIEKTEDRNSEDLKSLLAFIRKHPHEHERLRLMQLTMSKYGALCAYEIDEFMAIIAELDPTNRYEILADLIGYLPAAWNADRMIDLIQTIEGNEDFGTAAQQSKLHTDLFQKAIDEENPVQALRVLGRVGGYRDMDLLMVAELTDRFGPDYLMTLVVPAIIPDAEVREHLKELLF